MMMDNREGRVDVVAMIPAPVAEGAAGGVYTALVERAVDVGDHRSNVGLQLRQPLFGVGFSRSKPPLCIEETRDRHARVEHL